MRTLDPTLEPVVAPAPPRRRPLLLAAAVLATLAGGSVWASLRAPAPPAPSSSAPGRPGGQVVEVVGAPATVLPGAVAFETVTTGGAMFSVPAGKPTVLLFGTSTCADCLALAAELDAVARRFGPAVAMLAVEIDPWARPADVARFGEAGGGLHYPLAVDSTGSIHRPLRAFALETVVVLDGEGRVVYREIGPGLGSVLEALRGLGLA